MEVSMTLPYEWLIALQNTRSVLNEILHTKKIRVDEPLRKKVRGAMKHLPMDVEMSQLISVYQKNMTEWAKPEAAKKNYIVISRFDPVEYSAELHGWIYWHEDWATHSRVFFAEEECRKQLANYCENLDVRAEGSSPAPESAPAPASKPKKVVRKKTKPK